MTNPTKTFQVQRSERIDANANDKLLRETSRAFLRETIRAGYSYNFDWLSRPIIQYPQDIVAMQELVWNVRPDLIIETGIAHGGSLIFSASLSALLDYSDAVTSGALVDPKTPTRKVLGVDIEIRDHNRKAIEAHPMASRIMMIEGSSIAPEIVNEVRSAAREMKRITRLP